MSVKVQFWSYNDPDLHVAWFQNLSDLDYVEIKEGDILSEGCDILVSPANSFGFMDGGIDLHYRNFFGMELETRVKNEIINYRDGELPVGDALTVPTMNEKFQWLMVLPTMRTPTILRPSDPNIYLAAKRLAWSIKGWMNEGRDKIIAVPGLGTGVGKMPPDICAKHIRLAFDRVMSPKTWSPTCFSDAKLPGDTRMSMHDFFPSF